MTQERKLNFDAPILSVRRISENPKSPSRSEKKANFIENPVPIGPICKPDVSFDHLTEPVSVPFTWERIPGQRKENSNCNSKISLEDEEFDDADEVYSDALDTLSATGSVNCSIGDVSGFENPVLECSGKFSIDDVPESRSFMMNRFLLAAKAMTLDQQSQSSLKKKPQQHNEEQQPVLEQRRALIHPLPKHNDANEDDEDDDDEDEDDEEDDVVGDDDFPIAAKKGWRFLPRICVKNSMCILNPIPGLKIKTQKIGNRKSPAKTLIRVSTGGAKEGRSGLGVQSPGFSGSNRYSTGSKELLTPSWSSRRLSGFMSPYRSPSTGSPFHNSRSFGTPEKPMSFQVNRLSSVRHGTSKSQELYPRRPWETMGEKTACFDTGIVGRAKKPRNSNLGTTGKTDGLRKSCSVQDLRFLVKGGNITGRRQSDDLILDNECKNLGRIKIGSAKTDAGSETSSPVQPPLPTTPSQSWLWRTRGSVTPRSSVSDRYVNSRFNPKNPEASKSFTDDTKWETMVKTSFSHRDHVRYSEELITHPSRLISNN